MEEEITVTRTDVSFLTKLLKYRLTQTFDKLSYFLQFLGGSSYREWTEITLNERTRWNKPFFRKVCGDNFIYFLKIFHLKRTFEPQNNLPAVLLKTIKLYLWQKNITFFPSFTATVVYGVCLLFIYYHSIAIR